MCGCRIGLVDFEIIRYVIVGNGICWWWVVDGYVIIVVIIEIVDWYIGRVKWNFGSYFVFVVFVKVLVMVVVYFFKLDVKVCIKSSFWCFEL